MIGLALQKGSHVDVYDEKNCYLFSTSGELYGFTSTTVSVKRGYEIYTYNEKGVYLSNRRL